MAVEERCVVLWASLVPDLRQSNVSHEYGVYLTLTDLIETLRKFAAEGISPPSHELREAFDGTIATLIALSKLVSHDERGP